MSDLDGIPRRLIVIGAGGHGKVVADIALASGFEILGFLDDKGTEAPLPGFQVLGTIGQVPLLAQEWGSLGMAIAIGDNGSRKRIVDQLRGSGLPFIRLIHPSAIISPFAHIGVGTIVMPGAVVNAGAAVGEHAILNTCCSVDHDCSIGDFAHISPGVHLAGNVAVGEGSHLGIGAFIIPGQSIGEWSIVGAGAVVVKGIPPRVMAAGVPAAKIRDL